MPFVHPNIAIAAAGLALLPLVIQLLSRRAYTREPWAAMDFLLAAQRQTRRRLRLENFLLLALRTLVILLFGVAAARPYAAGSSFTGVLGQPRQDRVLIIDTSLSMRALRDDGLSAFDAARDLARRLVDRSNSGDGLAIMSACAGGRAWTGQPTYDRQAIRAALDPLSCTFEMNDLPGALRSASEVLSRGHAAPGGRVVYVLTDLTRASLPSSGGSRVSDLSLDAIDHLCFVNLGGAKRGNLAVTSLQCVNQVVTAEAPVTFRALATNYGDQPVDHGSMEIRLDGAVVQTPPIGEIAPGATKSIDFNLTLPHPGGYRIAAKLIGISGDGLAADDARYLVVDVPEKISVLIVEGRPDASIGERESFYYQVALESTAPPSGAALWRTKVIRPEELEQEVLADHAIVVLANVPRLTPDAWARMRRFVTAGGGLMCLLGDQVSAENYNNAAEGRGHEGPLLPIFLEEIVRQQEGQSPWGFRIADANHPALSDFRGNDKGGLLLAHVQGYWRCRLRTDPGAAGRTILALTSGEPAVVAANIERGRVVACTTGANMAWTNLPSKPDYLPMMLNLTLMAAGNEDAGHNAVVGQAISQRVAAREARLTADVQCPDGRAAPLTAEPLGDGSAFILRHTNVPGFYHFKAGSLQQDAAVNIDSHDSDLHIADEAALKAAFGAKAELVRDGEAMSAARIAPPSEFASLVMLALLVLVMSETLLGPLLGGRR